jgi:hypothetical protein
MAKVMTLPQALKLLGAFILAGVVQGFGPHLADLLMSPPSASVWARGLGVVIAVGSSLPYLALVYWLMGASDEYNRHILLVGTALAFILNLLAHLGLYALQEARFVDGRYFLTIWPTTVVVWLIGLTLATLYYRVRP